jgi:hypothetical protein
VLEYLMPGAHVIAIDIADAPVEATHTFRPGKNSVAIVCNPGDREIWERVARVASPKARWTRYDESGCRFELGVGLN